MKAVLALEESTLEFELSHQFRMASLANLEIVVLDLVKRRSHLACLLFGGPDE